MTTAVGSGGSSFKDGGHWYHKLSFDQDQLWVINENVRQQRGAPEYGQEHSLDLAHKLWYGIMNLEGKSNTIDIVFSHSEILQITRQISSFVQQGSRQIGKEILKQCFSALLKEGEADEQSIPDVFLNAWGDSSNEDNDSRPSADSTPES